MLGTERFLHLPFSFVETCGTLVLSDKASDNMLTAGATAPAATEIAPTVSTTYARKKRKLMALLLMAVSAMGEH